MAMNSGHFPQRRKGNMRGRGLKECCGGWKLKRFSYKIRGEELRFALVNRLEVTFYIT